MFQQLLPPNVLVAWLGSSWVFRPLLALLRWLDAALGDALQNSHALALLDALFNRNATKPAALKGCHWLHGILLPLGLAGLLVAMTFASTETLAVFVWTLGGLLLVSALWLGRWAALRQRHWVDALVALFFLTAVIATAFSSVQPQALWGLSKMLTYAMGYLLFRSAFAEAPQAVAPLMGLLVLLGVVQSGIGVYQWTHPSNELATWTDPSTLPEHQLMRVYGTLQPLNPNLLAGYLLATLGGSVWWLGYLAGQWGKLGIQRLWPWLAMALLATLAIVAGVVMTGSRGGYLGIGGIGLLSLLWAYPILTTDPTLRRHEWLKVLWLTVVASLVGFAALGLASSEAIQHRLLSIFSFREDSSIAYRLNVYQACWRLFLDNLWVGIGPSNLVFKPIYGLYMVPGFTALGAYSVPLEIAVEQGLLGLAAFGTLWLGLLGSTALHLHDARVPLQKKLWLGAIGIALLGFFFHGCFDTVWYRPSVQLLFWFFVAAWATLQPTLQSPLSPPTADAKEPHHA